MIGRIFLCGIVGLMTCAAGFASPVDDWHAFSVAVRDGSMPKSEARAKLAGLMDRLSAYCMGQCRFEGKAWIFPLAGYARNRSTVIANDFRPDIVYGPSKTRGYDFYDGNRHGGHPAFDIFIRDKDQDCLDDRTGRAVEACAMIDGVVVSVNRGWRKGDPARGGNYVWLYNPAENVFLYYAHLADITIEAGEFVKQGRAIGTVGRTGPLADRRASPTHVHLMVLEYRDGKLLPVNYLSKLP